MSIVTDWRVDDEEHLALFFSRSSWPSAHWQAQHLLANMSVTLSIEQSPKP